MLCYAIEDIPPEEVVNKQIFQTRLTYNCAHLRLTKEILTIEYLRIIKKIWVMNFWVEILLGEIFLGENFFG